MFGFGKNKELQEKIVVLEYNNKRQESELRSQRSEIGRLATILDYLERPYPAARRSPPPVVKDPEIDLFNMDDEEDTQFYAQREQPKMGEVLISDEFFEKLKAIEFDNFATKEDIQRIEKSLEPVIPMVNSLSEFFSRLSSNIKTPNQ